MLNMPFLQKGFTLVELLVASVISLVALSAIVTVYAATARHTTGELSRADLRQQMHTVAELMASDIRRSGYWAFDPLLQTAARNPFEQPDSRLRSGALDDETPSSCLLFSYDIDRDGLVGKGQCQDNECAPGSDDDNVEQFGYRLSRSRLQARYGGTEMTCSTGNWQTVTTPGIVISDLTFTLYSNCLNLAEQQVPCTPGQPALLRRAVTFSVEGSLMQDRAITLRLSRWINVRNAQLLEPQE
ncbi:prepilin-type N-terminal cleavage/methylation domain-containing protein [Thiogranum longum]|uniref:Prepilin-type N-terminal cleavage/methylation domain-containing protein n=1 Tax=Thiogranum longum TaxID=1537524 RepID=A0A4R1HFW1_9GAMM|nr:prepilin-type N-terminal cleavage/methylation domain-containing protein [Thiogranum longum]TCK19140.1 prepilin-type N-terminal cleavage/methylation domain-containing protein [Thiogranum longum]